MGAFLYSFYGSVLTKPNYYFFNEKGDAIKNYYVFASYLKNNNYSLDYDQMNYPYGEGFLFVDAHPLLALPLKALVDVFPSITSHSVGILNFLMLISLLITSIILYRIFLMLKIHPMLSVLGAIGICLLNAQIFRMNGHFSLSYGFFIPLIIYYILKLELGKARKRTYISLGLIVFAYYFLHAYAGLIASTLIIVYAGITILGKLFSKQLTKSNMALLLSGVIPLFIYYLIVKLSDSHTGRTTNPWGLFEYHANLKTVFLPILGPFNQFKAQWFGPIHQTEEGWAYVGVITMLGLLIIILSSIVYSIEKKTVSFHRTQLKSGVIRRLFLAGILILLLSMLIPIRLGMEFIVDWFPIIKQFRSMGRFAMVFYFVSTLVLIVLTNEFVERLRARKNFVIAYLLLFFVPMMLYIESVALHQDMSHRISKAKNLFDLNQTSESFQTVHKQLALKEFDAILPLPFFNVGSENFGIYGNKKIHDYAFMSSYFLDVPLIANMSARSSIWESKNKMQLLSSSFYPKEIAKDLQANETYLIVSINDSINRNEWELINKAQYIKTIEDGVSFYQITAADILNQTNKEEWENYHQLKDSLHSREGYLVSDSTYFFQFNNFGMADPITFQDSTASMQTKKKAFTKLIEIQGEKLELNKEYIARFWMYNGGENHGQDKLSGIVFFERTDGKNNKWLNLTNPKETYDINGNWSLIEIPLLHEVPSATYKLLYKGPDKSDLLVEFKDVLFYDSRLNIYREYTDRENKMVLFKNNHRISVN